MIVIIIITHYIVINIIITRLIIDITWHYLITNIFSLRFVLRH